MRDSVASAAIGIPKQTTIEEADLGRNYVFSMSNSGGYYAQYICVLTIPSRNHTSGQEDFMPQWH